MMNSKEKKLAKKLMGLFNSPQKKSGGFSDEENVILDRWYALNIINRDAFHDVTSHASRGKQYIYGHGYPFAQRGDEEYNSNWYTDFRKGLVVTIVRDILTVTAFLISLYLALRETGVMP